MTNEEKLIDKQFRRFLWEKHREEFCYILLGHTELLTDKLEEEFQEWIKQIEE